MEKSSNKASVSKIYCEKCNEVFNSKQQYDKHSSSHSSGVSSQSCPLDTVLGKIVGLFKKPKWHSQTILNVKFRTSFLNYWGRTVSWKIKERFLMELQL